MGACTIRYRRFLKLFKIFVIKSRVGARKIFLEKLTQQTFQVLCWDEKSVFIEHQFVTPSDNFVCAIVIGRTQILNCSAEEVMNELLASEPGRQRPEMPPEILKWIEYNELSSFKLKAVNDEM